jgi:hypothetical protein
VLIITQSSRDEIVHTGQNTTIATAAPVPDDAQPGSNTRCGEWYFVEEGDHCDSISIANGITLDDFYFLNPQVDDKCLDLRLGASYCVKTVGDVATYTDYSITTAATGFTRPTPAPTSTKSYPSLTAPALSAKASGTVEDCDEYQNAFTYDWGDLDEMNACNMWAWFHEISLQDLLRWNPSLPAENCILESGKSYCILKCKFFCLLPILHTVSLTPSSHYLASDMSATPTPAFFPMGS